MLTEQRKKELFKLVDSLSEYEKIIVSRYIHSVKKIHMPGIDNIL
jgi:hypothetical protein